MRGTGEGWVITAICAFRELIRGDSPELLWCRVVSAVEEVCGECENTEEGMSESGSVTV